MKKFLEDWTKKFIFSLQQSNTDEIISLLEEEKFESQFKNVLNYNQIFPTINNNVKAKFNVNNLVQPLSSFIANFFLYKINVFRKNYFCSFENLKTSFKSLQEFYQGYENEGLSPLLKYIIKLLYHIAIKADNELVSKKENEKCVSECGRIFISFFSGFQNAEDKLTAFYCVVYLMKTYFQLKTYRNSITLVNWFQKSGLTADDIPQSDFITFSFYQSRLAIYELNLLEAQDILSKAFEICICNFSDKAIHNARLIYEYLIPLNLFQGIYPKESAIRKYNLDNKYIQLTHSIKNGDVKKFESILESLEDRLIELGTFLIVGKLKSYVIRNLIKMVYQIKFEELDKMKTPFVKLESILQIMKNCYNNNEIEMEELEFNVIGVIYRGLIGGYVHNANKVIVLSKKNPFPALKEIIKNNYNKII